MTITIESAQHALAKSLAEISRLFRSSPGSAKWDDGMGPDSSITLRVKCHDLSPELYEEIFWHGVANAPVEGPLRYFLPRLLADFSGHVFVTHSHAVPVPANQWNSSPSSHGGLVTRLAEAQWRRWPLEEQQAIENWHRALIEYRIAGVQVHKFKDSVNCAARLGIDVAAILRNVLHRDRRKAALAIAELMPAGEGWPYGWQDPNEPSTQPDYQLARQYFSTLLGAEARAAIQDAFFATADKEETALLSTALTHADVCIATAPYLPGTPLAEAVARGDLPAGP